MLKNINLTSFFFKKLKEGRNDDDDDDRIGKLVKRENIYIRFVKPPILIILHVDYLNSSKYLVFAIDLCA